MKALVLLALAALVTLLGIALIFQRRPSPPPVSVSSPPPSPPPSPLREEDAFAEYDRDCGIPLLKFARQESGPFEYVYPVGEQRPEERLRRHVWELGRFRVHGHLTGKQYEVAGCGRWPEFEVQGFTPWGKVRRCASPGSADPSMSLFTGDLSEDRYVPEDFVDGPFPPMIDDESCKLATRCAGEERLVQDCTGQTWCCRLLPEGRDGGP